MITTGDIVNGLFEGLGSLFTMTNVLAILRDKMIRGFSPLPTVFWTLWGWWNLYYYPSLGQWFSFTGGVFLVTLNTIYLYLLWKYRKA